MKWRIERGPCGPHIYSQALEKQWNVDGWCPGEDSNLHELLHWYLKPARLPVPPPGQDGCRTRGAEMYALLRCLSTNADAERWPPLFERRTLWLMRLIIDHQCLPRSTSPACAVREAN